MTQDKNTRGLPGQISTGTSDTPMAFRLGFLGRWGVWIVLLVSLLTSVAAWYIVRGEVTKRANLRFEFRVKAIEAGIHERLKAYELMLQGGVGLFEASNEVTREDWRLYVNTLRIDKYYPGIQGVGFSRRILPTEKAAHIRQIRSEGFPQYTIKPDGERSEYTSIIFLEPFDWRNQRALGYDMFSEATRKEAMIRARDTGTTAMSGSVTLVQETDKDVQSGFLIYVAVYRKGEPLGTPEQRRKALMGYVYSPFRMNDFMQGIVTGHEAQVKLQIFDGDKPLKETLLYQCDIGTEPHHSPEDRNFATHQSILEHAGHRWLLDFSSSKYFEEQIETGLTTFILLLGITISLLLSGMVLSLTRSRGQAIALANMALSIEKANIELTGEITERKQADAKLRQQTDAMDAAIDGMALLNAEGEYVYTNKAHVRLYGYEKVEEIIGKSWRILYDSDALQRFDQEIMPEFSRKGDWNGEAVGTKINGAKFPQELSLTAMANGGLICVVRDITDRKQAEQELHKTQALIQRIIALSPAITYSVTPDFVSTWVTPNVESILGYTVAECLVPGWWVDHLHPDDRHRLIAEMPRVFGDGQYAHEYRFQFKGGFYHWIHDELRLFRDVQGNPTEIVGAWYDITERRRAEEELQANKAQLSNALEMAHLGHWEYDVANDLFTFNKQFYKIFRTTVEQVGGYTMHSAEYAHRFVHPDDMDMVGEETRKAIETTDPHFNRQFEHRMLYADGTVGHISVRFFIVKDSHGRTVKTYGVNQEITERKKSEKQLRDTLESLRKSMSTTIQVLVSTIEARDPYTAGHQLKSANLARAIATEMGLPQDKIEGLRMAASIHDIGKISIPAEILSKPTKLSDIEFSLIKEHAWKGYEMLKDVESPWPLAEIVYQHHERMDGSGYPRKLKGEEILMEARILSVADVVEAMASHRPYRPGLGIDAALDEIQKNRGTFYDVTVADACLRLFREKGFQLAVA